MFSIRIHYYVVVREYKEIYSKFRVLVVKAVGGDFFHNYSVEDFIHNSILSNVLCKHI